MEALIKVATPKKYLQGTKICEHTNNQSMFYVIVDGQVCVVVEEEGSTNKYSKLILGKGDFFGGLGLVAGTSKTIEAVALTQAVVLETSMEKVKAYKQTHSDGGMFYIELMKMYNLFSNKVKEALEPCVDLDGGKGDVEVKEAPLNKEEKAFDLLSIDSVDTNELQKTMLMPKTMECPLCTNGFKSQYIRETKVKSAGKSDFFMPLLEGIDPLWYEIIVCPECGYTEKISEFSKPIKYKKDEIKEALGKMKDQFEYKFVDYRSSAEVAATFAMYEVCQKTKGVEGRSKGRGALLAYEFYRRLGDVEKAALYRDKAFDYYKGMFKSGILDVTDKQMQQLYIILGKLHEHRGEYEEAKGEYRNAKMLRGDIEPKFVEVAENYLIDLEELQKNQS